MTFKTCHSVTHFESLQIILSQTLESYLHYLAVNSWH